MAGPPGPASGRPEDKLNVPAIHDFDFLLDVDARDTVFDRPGHDGMK
jgi:hypothetical protein